MTDFANYNKRILLVEDDIELASLIEDFLSRYGFEVNTVNNGTDAVRQVAELHPDLVILDVMLPGMNGMEVCKTIRAFYSGYILMQTALDDDVDQMKGLEIGADDYVIKQVKPHLLLSRIYALLRRSERKLSHANATEGTGAPAANTSFFSNTLVCGPLTVDVSNRSVVLNQVPVETTTAEFELLVLLASTVGQVVSRDEILQKIRGFEYDGLDRSIDRRISRLRQKLVLEDGKELIKTVRGIGYQLCVYTD
ncbi:Transcriptional regulatory protein RstA [Vibrio ruber DSM 16370]|uniref:Transcriptional regulatory protein RstA n=1 Tax=Vibrio ruber (strain DSM 16370 / JCM 11486 / BCRC 17186 / CECT 7878 / LMG 23124 / VR1) TaxID=1123498 RepID=A0A1R4LBG5_VIBR1|nr:response regulator transcription factor [Vibrio ruber]SJN53910.1 Transcriptional regulatory protein RstA [Vibrio ruber DSM 16370]